MGRECVVASQFRWTSKSVDLLSRGHEHGYVGKDRMHPYYEGYRSSLITVETIRMSLSARVTFQVNHRDSLGGIDESVSAGRAVSWLLASGLTL